MKTTDTAVDGRTRPATIKRDRVVIRFAGDSGDGMQLTGGRFTSETAMLGNDLATYPDFPAEIRAPAGSLPGVSGFQLHFADHDILTPGDAPNVLVAMNPAALKTNLADLPPSGILVVDKDAFTDRNLTKAGYAATTTPVSGPIHGVQLCQHHCPVSHVAEEFPELCETEREAFAEVLGTHVQRLATIINGDCACTTHVPLNQDQQPALQRTARAEATTTKQGAST